MEEKEERYIMGVYKRGDSPYWWITFQRNGRRVSFSSGTKDKGEALQLSVAVRQRADGLPRDRFLALVDAILGDKGSVVVTEDSLVNNLADTWMKTAKAEGQPISERTAKDRRLVCLRFAEWATRGYSKKLLLDSVTSDMAWRFVSDVGRTAKTRQNICGELSAVWASLIRRGLVKENPWRYARPKGNATEKRTGRAFTPDEIRTILKEAEECPWLKTAILIALYTGLRQGDVLALRWEDVDLEGGKIAYTPSKTKRFGTCVHIPIHPRLSKHLSALPRGQGAIIGPKGKHPGDAWKVCLERAGVKANGNELMTFHNLRHTFATWVREAGAEKGEQMMLGGWTNVSTSNRYDHAEGRLRDIVGGMPSV